MSPNMNVLGLLSILLVFYVHRTNGVPITYDFTDPLNAIRAGNSYFDEFSKDLKSHFGNLTKPLKLSVAYSIDCNIIVECGSTLNEAVQILTDVNRKLLTEKVKIEHINFRFRIGIGALQSLKNPMNQVKLNIPAGKHNISFFLPDNTTCDDLKKVTDEQWTTLMNSSTWVYSDSVSNVYSIGFGYNEDLIGCEILRPAHFFMTKYLLTTISLGKTKCVVGSFSHFKKRMDDLHPRNLEFTKDPFILQLPFIEYSSTLQCLEDKYHPHLLESYWERYTNNKIGATIPMPVGHSKIPNYSAKKIIPYIDAESCARPTYPWYAPAALEALSRYFGAVVLTHDEWTQLPSKSTRNARVANPDIRLDVFIDYTDWLQYNLENLKFSRRDYNWSVVESEHNELNDTISNPYKNVKVTTLIFPVMTSSTAENFTINVDTGFAMKMSSHLKIGCAFGQNTFGTLLNSTSSAVVAACKQVNGSIYTLQQDFKLKSISKVKKEYRKQFENVVRSELEMMRKFKDEILVLHSQATVYFQLRIELQMDDNQTTVFCNSEALNLNEYIEAIINWAALNGIPLMMGRAFDDNCQSKYQTWFSVLRPSERSLYYINPRFVLRNSPQILADAKVELCLEWTVEKPIITESYFHNNYVGSIFFTLYMQEGKTNTREEYKTLLQFTLHRFDLVLLMVTSDTYKDIIEAINTLASDGLISLRKKFFILYVDPRDEVDGEERFRDFYGFLNFTKVTLSSHLSLLKGIIVPENGLVSEDEKWNLNLRIRRNTQAFDRGRSLSLEVGVELSIDDCRNAILDAASQKLIPKEADNLLRTAPYLSCWESVHRRQYDNPKSLGMLFDTHYYIKKVYQELYPHLDVFFRIPLDVDLTKMKMNEYLILLSNFQKFASTHNLSYLIVNAFDIGELQIGWWKISNYSNLSLTSIYEERYSASVGFETWVPSVHFKQNQTTHTADDNKQSILLGVATGGFVLMIVLSGFLLWYYKNKMSQYLSNQEVKEFYNGKEGNGEEQISGDSEYRKFDKKFELAFADVFIDPKDLLGRGNFGTVYKGLVKDEPVAIKRPNDNCPATSFKSVLSEVKLLCYISTHPNVIQFVGAYTKEIRKGILYIATELCSNGSLDGLLRAKKRVVSNMGNANNEAIENEDEDAVNSHDLHRFAKEIASGMDYIAGKNVIHGDLAARNVLLDENLTCKIGDFGLSRKLYQYQEYVKKSQETLPWKWMAYESLKNMQFTTKSDMWSYGVTIWEIYSLGSVPYGGLSWTAGFTDELENGLRLQMPKYAAEEIYKAMLSCWELEADKRPTFTDIVDFFKELSSSQYIVLETQ